MKREVNPDLGHAEYIEMVLGDMKLEVAFSGDNLTATIVITDTFDKNHARIVVDAELSFEIVRDFVQYEAAGPKFVEYFPQFC